jgi:hypothetical protein
MSHMVANQEGKSERPMDLEKLDSGRLGEGQQFTTSTIRGRVRPI